MQKKSVKILTYGAMISAIYVVLFFIVHQFLSADSFIVILAPILLALYTFYYKEKNGAIVLVATSLACFLFMNPLMVLFLVFPNLLIGLVYGILERRQKSIILIGVIIFVVSLVVDLCTTFLLGDLFGINFIEEMKEFAQFLQNNISAIEGNNFVRFCVSLIPSIFILYSLIRSVLTILIYEMISQRLNMNIRFQKITFLLPYSWFHVCGYLFVFGLWILGLSFMFVSNAFGIVIMVNFALIALICYSLLILNQVISYWTAKYLDKMNFKTIILVFLAFILFPLTIIYGLGLNIFVKKRK